MAAQTDAPDDLIAELARLMADDARSDQTVRTEKPTPAQPSVRIPGADAPSVAPVPRFDFSASNNPAPKVDAGPSVRIPGVEAAPARPAESKPAESKPAEAPPEPFRFDFGANVPKRPAGPVTPISPAPEATPPAEPVPELDQDSLADLIAAELAHDMETSRDPLPPAPESSRTEDNFGVPPVFGLGAPAASPVAPAQSAEVVVTPEPFSEPEPVVETPAPEPEPEPQVEPEIAAVAIPAVVAAAPAAPTPSASADVTDYDALRDIERLVSPAVNMSREEAPRAPSAALRSLATPTLPVDRPVEPQFAATTPTSVDDAILAAAAATGARVEWVNQPEADFEADEPEPMPRVQRPPFRMSRAVAGPLVAVGLLGVAGLGLYWVLGQGSTPTGPAPLVVADTATIKEVPPPAETQPQQSVVFNEIAGGTAPAEEQIVSRDQADEATVSEAAAPSPAIADSGVLGDPDSGVDSNQPGLVNRKVRTVTVRPDGTIVSGEDSMAGATILPVDRPAVPEVPGADFSTPDLIASTIAEADGAPASGSVLGDIAVDGSSAIANTPPQAPAAAVVQPGAVVPVVDQAGAPVSGRSVTVPMQRPDDFAAAAASALAAAAVPATPAAATGAGTLPPPPGQSLVPAGQTPAPAAQAPAPAPAAATGAPAAAYAQLSSQRSEQAARETAQALATRYGVLFGGANLVIQPADLGERGVYYRVLVPASSRESAANICTQVRAAGGDCVLL